MVLNRLYDVAELQGLQGLLCEDSVEVVKRHEEVVKVSLSLLEGGGVSELSLIVRDGPLWGAHNTEVVVHVGVNTAEQGVL